MKNLGGRIIIGIILTVALFFAQKFLEDYFKEREKKRERHEQFRKDIKTISESKSKLKEKLLKENNNPVIPKDLLRDGKSITIVNDTSKAIIIKQDTSNQKIKTCLLVSSQLVN